jgi:hypothetical protein
MTAKTIGLDLAKDVVQVHGIVSRFHRVFPSGFRNIRKHLFMAPRW